jgi:hypothetical protein
MKAANFLMMLYAWKISPKYHQRKIINHKIKNIMKNYVSLTDALDDLRKRGYEADFETQSPCLYCSDLDLRLIEEEFNIDEVYRFEADSDPGSNAVVYAISSSAGIKGTIVDGLGASAGHFSFEMASKLQCHLVSTVR